MIFFSLTAMTVSSTNPKGFYQEMNSSCEKNPKVRVIRQKRATLNMSRHLKNGCNHSKQGSLESARLDL